MLFRYKAITKEGRQTSGDIEAQSQDIAVNSLQRSGLIVVSVQSDADKSFFEYDFAIFNRVGAKDVSVASRQIATLLEAHVPALRTFRLLASETGNTFFAKKLTSISDDIQNGISISDAFYKYPSIFSDFFINMVRAGEESGKLPETFVSLADYLERSYEVSRKVRGALIYPAFVISVFIVVMILLLVLVVPNLAEMITSTGQEIPFFTKIVIGASSFLVHYGIFTLVLLLMGGFAFWRYTRGTDIIDNMKINAPVFGNLYRMVCLSRISDNMHTMLSNGITMVRGMELTSRVVDNKIYQKILIDAVTAVKGGAPLSDALGGHPEIPNAMILMIKVGEETGDLANILEKLSTLYRREVDIAVDAMVSLIEPAMIVALGIGVGGVLAAVLIPIYQVAGNI
ncbi:MAG: type II secretion system F family protein [Candidatus Pacebacteria bacterium]|nr:type II secretion system F family protein [Candidatus Paceibacterota bacterium]